MKPTRLTSLLLATIIIIMVAAACAPARAIVSRKVTARPTATTIVSVNSTKSVTNAVPAKLKPTLNSPSQTSTPTVTPTTTASPTELVFPTNTPITWPTGEILVTAKQYAIGEGEDGSLMIFNKSWLTTNGILVSYHGLARICIFIAEHSWSNQQWFCLEMPDSRITQIKTYDDPQDEYPLPVVNYCIGGCQGSFSNHGETRLQWESGSMTNSLWALADRIAAERVYINGYSWISP